MRGSVAEELLVRAGTCMAGKPWYLLYAVQFLMCLTILGKGTNTEERGSSKAFIKSVAFINSVARLQNGSKPCCLTVREKEVLDPP